MFIKTFIVALITFMIIDFTWLGFIAKNFYNDRIGNLMKDDVNWTAAIIFYVLFVIGLIVFVINPALESGSWIKALTLGALFGLITYATYDLTNLALTKDWPLSVTIVDLVWGAFLAASVSTITFMVISRMS
jgi:uncharacterized membrane protein